MNVLMLGKCALEVATAAGGPSVDQLGFLVTRPDDLVFGVQSRLRTEASDVSCRSDSVRSGPLRYAVSCNELATDNLGGIG